MENEIRPFEKDIQQWLINNKIIIILFFYLITDIAIGIGFKINSTGLGGPGTDFLILAPALFVSLILILISAYKAVRFGRGSIGILIIHIIGFIGLIIAIPIVGSFLTYFNLLLRHLQP